MPTLTTSPPAPTTLLTAADFMALPGEDKRDLIDGHLITDMAPPSRRHEDIAAFLLFLMRGFASARDLGKVYGSKSPVQVDEYNVFEPDVVFVSSERSGIVLASGVMTSGPDVAVEIVSPSSKRRDYADKFAGYQLARVGEYWLIDPIDETARFHRLDDHDEYTDVTPRYNEPFVSAALPGFRIDPADVLADPLPNEYHLLTRMLA